MVKVKKDLTGQKFGRLTVIRQAEDYVNPNTGKHSAKWECQCECGNIKVVVRNDLCSGKTLSCGCLNKDILHSRASAFRIGENSYTKYGTKATILDYKNSHDVLIEFEDRFHYQYVTSYKNFINGNIINPYDKNVYGVGCFGVGEYDSKNEAYSVWYNMIERCYKQSRGKADESYIGCTTCEEWHIYQNFAKWYNENTYPCSETLMIDKDFMGVKDKRYSPQTCILIPKTLNLALINSLREKPRVDENKDLPIGVEKHNNKYMSRISVGRNSISLGSYSTIAEAKISYQQAKKEYLLSLISKYKDIMPTNLYEKITNQIITIYSSKENDTDGNSKKSIKYTEQVSGSSVWQSV